MLPILVTLGLLVPGALAGCTSSTGASGDLLLPVAVGLQRDTAGLEQWLQQAADPTSADFLKPLTSQQVVSQFGASPEDAASALQVLQEKGFVGALDASGSILIGTMPASQAESTFDVKIEQKVDNGVTYAYPSRAPKIPDDLASVVIDVAGLAATVTGTGPSASAVSPPASTDVQCPGLSEAIAKMAAISGAESLQSSGIDGSGVRLAVLEVAAVSQASIEAAKSCSGMAIPPVSSTLVGATQPSALIPGSSEPVLDVLAASALAPGLDGIVAYQFDPYSSIVFPLAAAVGDALAGTGPDILSTSVGFCEATEMTGELTIGEWLLAVGAAGGLTTVASAGDTGSSACAPESESESVQYPATSAYATAVGGTTVDVGSSGGQQAVWNADGNAGGGAQTSTLPRPWYQSSVPGPGNRIVPDVASVAAPSEFPPIPICSASGCQLQQVGGTSAAAPAVAAGLALVLQDLRKQRGNQELSLGSVNPVLYSLASGGGAGVLSDVTQGNNDLYSVGCCQAAVGYDAASGWGWLNFGALATAYPKGS